MQQPAESPAGTGNLTGTRNRQPEGRVSFTINSAKKQAGLGEWGKVYAEPIPGNVYLVLNITLKNTGEAEGYLYKLSSVQVRDIEHGTVTSRSLYIREALRKYLENPLIPPITIQQHDAVTGQILLDVNDTVEYRVNLVENKTVLASQPVNFENLMTAENPVSITIHSARKLPNFTTTRPMPGHIFLILDVTIKNNAMREGYVVTEESITVRNPSNGDYARSSLNNGENVRKNLENPIIPPRPVKQNASVSGQILFGIADSTVYQLNLLDTNKTVIASREIRV